MEDSLKGFLVTATMITIFITAVLSFITLFPQEQGVSFSGRENSTYLVMQTQSRQNITSTLSTIENDTGNGFDQWDITQGFMGSNQIKQITSKNTKTYKTNIFSTIQIIATELFGANSPVIWVILVLSGLAGSYLIYLAIKNIRTGL